MSSLIAGRLCGILESVTMIGYVNLSGPPASGTTTLAACLAETLGLPYLAKDTIKEAVIAKLGAADVDASRRLAGAASS